MHYIKCLLTPRKRPSIFISKIDQQLHWKGFMNGQSSCSPPSDPPSPRELWRSWKVAMQCQIVASSDLQSHGGFPGRVSSRAGGGLCGGGAGGAMGEGGWLKCCARYSKRCLINNVSERTRRDTAGLLWLSQARRHTREEGLIKPLCLEKSRPTHTHTHPLNIQIRKQTREEEEIDTVALNASVQSVYCCCILCPAQLPLCTLATVPAAKQEVGANTFQFHRVEMKSVRCEREVPPPLPVG